MKWVDKSLKLVHQNRSKVDILDESASPPALFQMFKLSYFTHPGATKNEMVKETRRSSSARQDVYRHSSRQGILRASKNRCTGDSQPWHTLAGVISKPCGDKETESITYGQQRQSHSNDKTSEYQIQWPEDVAPCWTGVHDRESDETLKSFKRGRSEERVQEWWERCNQTMRLDQKICSSLPVFQKRPTNGLEKSNEPMHPCMHDGQRFLALQKKTCGPLPRSGR